MQLNSFLLATIILLVSQSVTLCAQDAWEKCGQLNVESTLQSAYPTRLSTPEFEQWLAEKSRETDNVNFRSTLSIPVIVHVIHNGEAIGDGTNISYEQVRSQIEVLNEDFQKLSGTRGYNDLAVGANVGIEFCPAVVDENGQILEESGVDRYDGQRFSWTVESIESELKAKTYWNPSLYFNMWVLNLSNEGDEEIVGYAQFPSGSGISGLSDNEGPYQTDGVVIDYSAFGSSDKGDFPQLKAPFDLGRVATHETGHWLGLRHIWGDGPCGADDYCSDTPSAQKANYECTDNYSCNSLDMVENYMDYTDDACMNVFTEDQKTRILTVLENSPRRKELLESTVCEVSLSWKLAATKIEVYPNPTADELNVNIYLQEDEDLDLKYELLFFNAAGALQFTSTATVNEITNLSLLQLPPGIYVLQIISGSFSENHKIVKI